jgi:hypothetical protein
MRAPTAAAAWRRLLREGSYCAPEHPLGLVYHPKSDSVTLQQLNGYMPHTLHGRVNVQLNCQLIDQLDSLHVYMNMLLLNALDKSAAAAAAAATATATATATAAAADGAQVGA